MWAMVVISPATTATPVVIRVSQATRPLGSCFITSSRTASEIWSAILSGWPSVTDSDVNRKLRKASLKLILLQICGGQRLPTPLLIQPSNGQFPAFIGKGLGRVVVRFDVELSLGLFGHQVRADEGVQIAVHDAIHVADFKSCPVVLDEAIRLHDVGADLTAEGNVQFALVELVGVRLAFFNFFIVQA